MSIILSGQGLATNVTDKTASDVIDGLLCMAFFGVSVDRSMMDRSVASDAAMTQVGSVVVTAGGVTFTAKTDYFLTDIPEPDSYTVFHVGRFPGDTASNAGRGVFSGNLAIDNTGMAFGYQNGANTKVVHGRRVVNASTSAVVTQTAIVTTTDPTAWALYYGTYDAATFTAFIRNETEGVQGANAGEGTYNALSKGVNLRIGSHMLPTSQQGPTDQSQFRIYNRVLSAAEIAAVIAEMRLVEQVAYGRTV